MLEQFCETVSGQSDIWYATNLEICNYVSAFSRLRANVGGTLVQNPTILDLTVSLAGRAGSRVTLRFRTATLSPRITRIGGFHTERMYLIKGARAAVLLDTGCGFGDLRTCVASHTDKPLMWCKKIDTSK
ncbi:MAG: hypothetical protein HFF17_05855 [Oscillospiraceae bacterium]|nr:hypothetical protein [Oscillospiraceae bacterium]